MLCACCCVLIGIQSNWSSNLEFAVGVAKLDLRRLLDAVTLKQHKTKDKSFIWVKSLRQSVIMEHKYASAPPQDKGSMAQGQLKPPPYQDLPPAGYPQPGPGQPQYGVGAYPQQPYPGQPYPGQPYTGQPYAGQPYPQQTVITVQQNPALSPPENDYLGYSIFTLLCCCMPLGIAALIYSIFTREANHNGDRPGAERNSRCARILNHTALGLGLVVLVLTIIYLIV